MESETGRFPVSFTAIWTAWSGVGVVAALVSAAAIVVLVPPVPGGPAPWSSLLITLPAALAVSAALCWFYVRMIVTVLGPEGIRARDALGAARSCPWSAIDAVSVHRGGRLFYMRIDRSDGERPLWVPMHLRDRDAFWSAVAAVAPEGNALRALGETLAD